MSTPVALNPQGVPVSTTKAPESGGTIYINILDEITMQKVKIIMATCAQLVAQKRPEILYFLFSSPGGQVGAGITLFNFLKGLPCKIVMHNTGSIDSIATVIFLAGDERYAALGTSFHFHGVATTLAANTRLTASALIEMHSHLKEDETKIATIVAKESNLTVQELRDLFKQGESKGLEFALEKGLIQEVRHVEIPRNAQFLSLNIP